MVCVLDACMHMLQHDTTATAIAWAMWDNTLIQHHSWCVCVPRAVGRVLKLCNGLCAVVFRL